MSCVCPVPCPVPHLLIGTASSATLFQGNPPQKRTGLLNFLKKKQALEGGGGIHHLWLDCGSLTGGQVDGIGFSCSRRNASTSANVGAVSFTAETSHLAPPVDSSAGIKCTCSCFCPTRLDETGPSATKLVVPATIAAFK